MLVHDAGGLFRHVVALRFNFGIVDHLVEGVVVKIGTGVDELAGLEGIDIVAFVLDVGAKIHDAAVDVLDLPLGGFPFLRGFCTVHPAYGAGTVFFFPFEIRLNALDDLFAAGNGFLLGLLLEGQRILDLLLAGRFLVEGRLCGLGVRIVHVVILLFLVAAQPEFRKLAAVFRFDRCLFLESLLQVIDQCVRNYPVVFPVVAVELILHRPEQSGLEKDAAAQDTVSVVAGQLVIFFLARCKIRILLPFLVGDIRSLILTHQVHRHHRDGHYRWLGIIGLERTVRLEVGHQIPLVAEIHLLDFGIAYAVGIVRVVGYRNALFLQFQHEITILPVHLHFHQIAHHRLG